ncbi:MAG: hypothetical protein ACJ76N_15105 [Thermoanaerobaculia bacterium]
MASLDDKRILERQRFFDGQRLLAADLDEVVADHRWRRELHNRSLHQPGIGNGFAVTGEIGGREVTIGAGYALDAYGREIISTRARVEPVPPVAGDPTGGPARYDLTVSYPSEQDLEETETREGVCRDRGVVRLAEEPVFCWVRLEEDATGALHAADPRLAIEINAALKIRLARVEVEQCRLKTLSIAERRNARPPVQPYIACGSASPVWRVEPIAKEAIFFANAGLFLAASQGQASLAAADTEQPFFLVADVDTSAAGFGSPPCYSAGLRGPRLLTVPLPGGKSQEVFADGMVSIEDSTAAGFRVRVLPLLLIDRHTGADADWSQVTFPWTVAWMGVEG